MVFSAGGQLAGGAMPIPASWPAAAGPGWVTYFGVIETDASIAAVSRLGAQVLVGPENLPYGRSALLSDPAGAVFGLISVAGAAGG